LAEHILGYTCLPALPRTWFYRTYLLTYTRTLGQHMCECCENSLITVWFAFHLAICLQSQLMMMMMIHLSHALSLFQDMRTNKFQL